MRFTKIPLIATLMAVALSLLIVLPALAQSNGYDDTRGKLKSGDLTVDVLNGADDDNETPDVDEGLAHSLFNRTLYVSNDGDAHNMVRITAATLKTGTTALTSFPGADGQIKNSNSDTMLEDDNAQCAVATIQNNRSGKKITVGLESTDPSSVDDNMPDDDVAPYMGSFAVIDSGDPPVDGQCVDFTSTGNVNEAIGQIPAQHGDTLTVTVKGLDGSVPLTVDGKGPEFSDVSPEHNTYTSSQTVKIRFVVTDSDSGLAHDGELTPSRDGDPKLSNHDGDNTVAEPLSVSGPTDDDDKAKGASRDIDVMFKNADMSELGSSGWQQRGGSPGVSYFLDMAIAGVDEGSPEWYLSATDRAGNTARTTSDPDEKDKAYKINVDVSAPDFMEARTGITYNASKKREEANPSYIAITFGDSGNNSQTYDAIRSDSIDTSKFRVAGSEIVGAIHLSDKSDCEDEDEPKDIDENCLESKDTPQSRIYLELAEPLAPDAKPRVEMFGGAVLDLAGNPSNQDEIDAKDLIAPGLMVTLDPASSSEERPVLKGTGQLTVTITSNEELPRSPAVFFAKIVNNPAEGKGSTDKKVDVVVGSFKRATSRISAGPAANTWSRTYTRSEIGSDDGLYAVIVTAEDSTGNFGATEGWDRGRMTSRPESNAAADLDDLAGLLVEIDKEIQKPGFSLSPETGTDTKKTESANPFVTVDFSTVPGRDGEDKEYATAKAFKGDSHPAVEITSATLGGNDVSDGITSVSNRKYTLSLSDLAVDSYELKVTGQDDAGNTVTASYKFDVIARKPYELNLTPGWNLVSLPGTPLDSSVGAVMGDSMEASVVLAYQNGEWLAATPDTGGTWRGNLTDIMGGYGYWVQTTAFESIKALIPETDTSSILPTARVIAGWNLLGVVDVQQVKAGSAPGYVDADNPGKGDADDYFNNISWKVAYSFDTSDNAWSRVIPDGDNSDAIENGKGYWVWSSSAGTLVP